MFGTLGIGSIFFLAAAGLVVAGVLGVMVAAARNPALDRRRYRDGATGTSRRADGGRGGGNQAGSGSGRGSSCGSSSG